MKTTIVKTSFTSGEVSTDLFGRGDLVSYQNGAKILKNVNVLRTGGVIRRSGSVHLGVLNGKARIEKIKNNDGEYLCVFTDRLISFYKNKDLLTSINSPWDETDLPCLHFTTHKGKLIVCSGTKPVQKITVSEQKLAIESMALLGLSSGVFNSLKGYPICSGFIQGRFVLAGTNAYPNRIWFSKSGSETDFSLGQGLADEGIDLQLLSGSEERITGIYPAKNLIVLTNTGEWVVDGDPITPEKITVSRHSRVGSCLYPMIQPVDADGDIFFVPSDRRSLYSIATNITGDAYNVENAVSLSKHLMRDISSMKYSSKHNRMFCVKDDGTMAVMTYDKGEGVMAWSVYETQGNYIDICVSSSGIYTVVQRSNGYMLECFDKCTLLDGSILFFHDENKDLSSLNNSVVGVVADGIVRSNKKVIKGAIALPAGSFFMIGKRYKHIIESLPFESSNSGSKMRLRKLTLRLKNTASLNINIGRGLQPLPFKKFGTGILNTPVALFTGDKNLTTLGWQEIAEQSLYKIIGDDPLPITILSIKADISINS